MNADRVKIFHRAYSNYITFCITDNFKLYFFPAAYTFFNEYLCNGGKSQTVCSDFVELFGSICDTAARTAESECRADYNRIADYISKFHSVINIFNDFGGNTGLTDFLHSILESLSVLSLMDSKRVCAEEFYIMGIEETFFRKLHGESETCLTAECGKEAVRFFHFDYTLYDIECKRFDIYLIRHSLVSHNSSRV